MRATFTKFGPKYDYRGAHVVMELNGVNLLGTITAINRDDARGVCFATVRHFCGDEWPIRPALSALEILEHTYE